MVGGTGEAPRCAGGASFSRLGFCPFLFCSKLSALPAFPSHQLAHPQKVKCFLPLLGTTWEELGVSESVCTDAHIRRHVSGCDHGRVSGGMWLWLAGL